MDISVAGFRLTVDFPGFELQRQRKKKTHNYTQQVQGCHYFLSPAEDSKIHMTAYGRGVKCHDYILLNGEFGSTQYQVEIIEYYGDLPKLWMALLVKR
jgi:hypothetical protein